MAAVMMAVKTAQTRLVCVVAGAAVVEVELSKAEDLQR